jgi:hypothetical protein
MSLSWALSLAVAAAAAAAAAARREAEVGNWDGAGAAGREFGVATAPDGLTSDDRTPARACVCVCERGWSRSSRKVVVLEHYLEERMRAERKWVDWLLLFLCEVAVSGGGGGAGGYALRYSATPSFLALCVS